MEYKFDVKLGSSRQESVYRDGSNDESADYGDAHRESDGVHWFVVCCESVLLVRKLNKW